MKGNHRWLPLYLSLAITPVCLIIAAISGGVGHGDYTLGIFIFPWAALFIIFFDPLRPATVNMIGLAAFQFPLYGFALSVGAQKRTLRSALIALLLLHVVVGTLAVWAAKSF